jgi:hypothetical protein
MAERAATHTSWRQMKGMERVMFEVSEDELMNAGGPAAGRRFYGYIDCVPPPLMVDSHRMPFSSVSTTLALAQQVNHPGNRPFVIGFVLTTTTLMYTYFSSLGSPSMEAQSKYWQRFHAKKTDGHH